MYSQPNYLNIAGMGGAPEGGISQPQSLLNGLLNWGKTQRQEGGLLSNTSLFGDPKTGGTGLVGHGLGTAGGVASAYLGMKQYGLAKQQLGEARRQFDLNYGTQRKLVNTQMEDRQRARVAANPTDYQSVGDYMNQNRI
jgi:hypothetical protein